MSEGDVCIICRWPPHECMGRQLEDVPADGGLEEARRELLRKDPGDLVSAIFELQAMVDRAEEERNEFSCRLHEHKVATRTK